LSGVKSN